MNILMLSLDPSLLDEREGAGDVRSRHITYARILNGICPHSHLHILVRSPVSQEPQHPIPSLSLYPVPAGITGFAWHSIRAAQSIGSLSKIDLITTQSPFVDGVVGALLAGRWNVPLLVQLHLSSLTDPNWLGESPANRIRALLARWTVRRAAAVRVNTEAVSHWAQSELGLAPERLHVVPVAPPNLPMMEHSEPATVPTVLYVGRLSREKGVDLLIDAFAHVVAHLPEARLVIVGDGDQRVALQRRAREQDLNGSIEMTGFRPVAELSGYYRRAWVVVVPSRHESYGRVILEAMGMARPVLATDTEGARALIRDGVDGAIVPRDDSSALAERLLALLNDPQELARLGSAGAVRIEVEGAGEKLRRRLVETWIAVGRG